VTATATATTPQPPPVQLGACAVGAGRAEARRGVLETLPLLAGYAPFALVIGATAAAEGAPLAGWTGSWLIYGGSAHLATMRTLGHGGLVAAILTGLLVNARLALYSTSLSRHWASQPRWFKLAAAALLIDATWATAERHAERCPDARRQREYFLGVGLTLGVGWSLAMAVGAVAGARLDGLDLDVVVPLCLLSLLGPGLRARDGRVVVVVAAAVAFLTTSWPAGTGLLAAIGVGCVAGRLADHRRPR
jgi:predicted branched-subunit amino acid permease